MEYFEIHIEGKQFEKNYLIYIIEVKHINKGSFFYIGQTGDRHFKTARPAFRRLAGHLSDSGHSTENQIYKQIAEKLLKLKIEKKKKFSNNVKNKVSDFLIDCQIKMSVFPIIRFEDIIKNDEHTKNREYVENIERFIIVKLINKWTAKRILNKKISKPKLFKDTEEKANEIIKVVFD